MPGLFAGTSLERPVTCAVCEKPLTDCTCPRDASGTIIQPSQQTARVRLEKRGKGKVVTTISGLDPVASDLPGLLKKLKSSCGAGGTIETGAIEIQGDHRDRITEFLRKLGYQVKSN